MNIWARSAFVCVMVLAIILTTAFARDLSIPTTKAVVSRAITQMEAIAKQVTKEQKISDQQVLSHFRTLLQISHEVKSFLIQESSSALLTNFSKADRALWENDRLYNVLAGIESTKLTGGNVRIYNMALAKFNRHMDSAGSKRPRLSPLKGAPVMPIVQYPDQRLTCPSQPVEVFDNTLKLLTDKMLETMYQAHGVGLAAPQVGINQRVFVIDASFDQNQPQVFVNPTIKVIGSEARAFPQGCLSITGAFRSVTRPARVHVAAQDCQGKPFSMDADGLKAVILQHEMDHLNGKLFIDYLPSEQRKAITSKLSKKAD